MVLSSSALPFSALRFYVWGRIPPRSRTSFFLLLEHASFLFIYGIALRFKKKINHFRRTHFTGNRRRIIMGLYSLVL